MEKNCYLKFLVATEKISAQFSEHEKRVLKEIFTRGSDAPFHVQEILDMKAIASQATLHKTIATLVKDGYLTLKPSKEDGRVKYILITKKANKLLEKINHLLTTSVG
jgi:DNA-binding MarR family transcriptional regulator